MCMRISSFCWFNSLLLSRYICITAGCATWSECSWNIAGGLGDMWLFEHNWSTVLCWIRHSSADIGRWLCLYKWGLWQLPGFSISLGCSNHFCVSFLSFVFDRRVAVTKIIVFYLQTNNKCYYGSNIRQLCAAAIFQWLRSSSGSDTAFGCRNHL